MKNIIWKDYIKLLSSSPLPKSAIDKEYYQPIIPRTISDYEDAVLQGFKGDSAYYDKIYGIKEDKNPKPSNVQENTEMDDIEHYTAIQSTIGDLKTNIENIHETIIQDIVNNKELTNKRINDTNEKIEKRAKQVETNIINLYPKLDNLKQNIKGIEDSILDSKEQINSKFVIASKENKQIISESTKKIDDKITKIEKSITKQLEDKVNFDEVKDALSGFYTKEETYNKKEIDSKIDEIEIGGTSVIGRMGSEINDTIAGPSTTRSSEKIQEEISAVDSSVTLLDISANSTTAPNSIYNLTSGIPVDFKSSDGNTLLYLDETNERVGMGTATPAYKLDIYSTGSTGGINTNIGYNITPVVAPTATFTLTPTAGAGLEIGTYYYAVVYYTAVGDTSASARLGVTTTGGNQQVSITNIPVSSDPSVVGRKIYRGKVGEGGSYGGLITTITNNTATTYTDTTPDSSLTGSIFTRAIYGKPNFTSKYISINGTKSLIADATGLTTLGYEAGRNVTVAPQTTLIGYGAGRAVTYENGNTLVGYNVGAGINGGLQNVGVGTSTLQLTTSGSYNVGLGPNVLFSNTVGSHNFAAGYYAGYGNTGSGNIYLGSYSGYGATYSGSYNINIGYNTDPVSTSSDYQLNIGNFIYGTTSGTKALGINTTSPDRMFEVLDASNPQLRLTHTDGSVYTDFQTTSAGYLYLNPSGSRVGLGTTTPMTVLEVQSASSDPILSQISITDSSALATGNGGGFTMRGVYTSGGASTSSGGIRSYKINATNGNYAYGMAFYTRTNGTGNLGNPKMFIDDAGNVGIGTTGPDAKLDVLSTTEQLRLGYDASNYYSTTVSSTGSITFNAVGSGAGFTYSDKVILDSTIRLKNYTVATLPAGTQGDTAFVTDALAPTYLTAVMGGGAIVTPVFYNGTNRVAN